MLPSVPSRQLIGARGHAYLELHYGSPLVASSTTCYSHSALTREPFLCTCHLNLVVGAKTLKKHSKLQETHLPISSGQFYPLHQQRPKAEFCIGSPSRAVLYERVGFNHICGLNCKQMIWLHGTAEPKGLANGVKK